MVTQVVIGIITYLRPERLARLLETLGEQRLPADVAMRVLVVDNDPEGSAEVIAGGCGYPVDYVLEPDPGIPAARQRSVDATLAMTPAADAMVFVDDDEWVDPLWLATLVSQWRSSGADIVTGPVHGVLPPGAPAWNSVSDVHSSVGRHRTGDLLAKAYTNNTLVSRAVLERLRPAFDNRFRFIGGSDLHFFQRAHRAGFRISWCEEAVAHELVPVSRTTLTWLLRRGYRAGAGDTISRRLISPGLRTSALSTALGAARIANGLALVAGGALARRPDQRIKGVRRIASGAGTLAGLTGRGYAEYRR